MNRSTNNMYGNMPNGRNTNRNMPNGNMNPGGRLNKNGRALMGDLGEQIRSLCFVKTELELYLDTHPDCPTALDYYYKTVAELKRLTEQYENTVGPLSAMGVVAPDKWTWVKEPWPWQRDGDYKQPREDR